MKNSTLGRKPGNDMKANASITKPVRRSDQSGDGESFAFNGQMGDGVNRAKRNNVCANPYTIGDAALSQNFGLMQSQRRGNASSSPKDIGPSVTRDKREMTMATAAQGRPVEGSMATPRFANPDKINVG